MDGLFDNCSKTDWRTTGFGPAERMQQQPTINSLELPGDAKLVRQSLRNHCPDLPGVYGMIDEHNELIYVGMSKRLCGRLLTYFRKGAPKAKEPRIGKRARQVIWETGAHELIVRLRELELIRRWRPRFNSVGLPGKREIGFVYLTSGDAPQFRFGRQPPKSSLCHWGPLPKGRKTSVAISRLNHMFMLRDCSDRTPMRYVEQRLLVGVESTSTACLRGEIGTCLAPCTGDRARSEYFDSIRAACAFLDGHDRSMIENFECAMHSAAANWDFEQAAAYRDIVEQMSGLWDTLKLVRKAQRDYWFIYPVVGASGETWWLIIAAGRVLKIMPQPTTSAAVRSCRQWIHRLRRDGHYIRCDDYDQICLVASWFRRQPQELQAVVAAEPAMDYCSSSPSGVKLRAIELMQ